MHLEHSSLSAVTVRICMFVSSRTNLHTCTLPLAGSRSPLVKYARGSHIGFPSTSQTRSCALRMPRYVIFTEIYVVVDLGIPFLCSGFAFPWCLRLQRHCISAVGLSSLLELVSLMISFSLSPFGPSFILWHSDKIVVSQTKWYES